MKLQVCLYSACTVGPSEHCSTHVVDSNSRVLVLLLLMLPPVLWCPYRRVLSRLLCRLSGKENGGKGSGVLQASSSRVGVVSHTLVACAGPGRGEGERSARSCCCEESGSHGRRGVEARRGTLLSPRQRRKRERPIRRTERSTRN